MRHQLCAILTVTATISIGPSQMMAATPQPLSVNQMTPRNALVIKTHSRRRAHDMLHSYGYHRVIFRRQFYDSYNKPVYRFAACRGDRRFRIDVNWYGDIMSRRRTGFCADYYERRYDRRYDRRRRYDY